MNIEQNYRIGLTTQITGIRPETLRAWERRYEVVKPIRTDAGDRLYTQADIDRLLLIKKLVDNGDAIAQCTTYTFFGRCAACMRSCCY